MSKIVVFGIFDGVHDGHRSLFRQALRFASLTQGKREDVELVAIVGRDEICERLKGRKPQFSEDERCKLVMQEPEVDNVLLGDLELSQYSILESVEPYCVCLGYDQKDLYEDIAQWKKRTGKAFEVRILKPYKPEVFHTSKLRKG